MIIRNIPLRHELKYFITPAELNVLRSSLKPVMQLDPNGNENNEYHIRSLYFDTINDDALEEKIAGVGNRKKYRIRIYNNSPDVIKFECKQKHGNAVRKLSAPLTRRECEALLAGDYTREAYVYPFQNCRVTFDKNLMAPVSKTGLFDAKQPRVAVFPQGVLIMEVKYDGFLPDHIRELIQLGCREAQANSKYVLCRAAAGR